MPKPPPTSECSVFQDACEGQKMPDVPTAFLTPLTNKYQNVLEGESSNENRSEDDQFPIDPMPNGNCNFSFMSGGDGAVSVEMTNCRRVDSLKTDFYEKPSTGHVVVRIQPKPLDVDSVKVRFAKDEFEVEFRTKDQKFLSAHENSTEDTWFSWTCHLFDAIVPDQCHVRIQSLVEITLHKANPGKKWTSLSVVQVSETPRANVSNSETNQSFSYKPKPFSYTSPTVPSFQSKAISTKPAYKNPHFYDGGLVAINGFTGLRNFGNTCFMNASLQVLVNTHELRDYFLENYYIRDISRTNPLGYKGRLADAFGQFVQEMWNGHNRVYEPLLLKELVGLKASQFANFAQHDAQEFLSFLLDGLHEDLNRVGNNKPLIPTVESDGRPDPVVADESWHYHRMRNDSFVVDLFHGQLKSHLKCLTCGHTSITFDPFVYLPVPFPKSRRSLTFYFWSIDFYAKPVKYTLTFLEDGLRIADVFGRLSEMINVKPTQFRMIEVFRQKVFKRYTVDDRLELIRSNDTIFIFQVHDADELNEKVVELTVLQRLRKPGIPVSGHCAGCGKESGVLRACTKCQTVAYCDVTCQKNDWSFHQTRCRPSAPELVGQPFMISFPVSVATYPWLIQALEARAQHTVDVFETAVADGDDCGSNEAEPMDDHVQPPSTSDSLDPADGQGQTDECRPAKRIRVILGEPQQQFRVKPLFQLALTNEDGENVRFSPNESGKASIFANQFERFKASGDVEWLENLENDVCIAMEWIDAKMGNDRLVVLTKDEIDCIEHPSLVRRKSDDTLDLADLFEHFTETEILSADDAWYCGRCKEHRQAKKTLQLWRLPSILVVQLKRFVYTSSIFRNKVDKHVVYPISSFDVSPYMCEGARAGVNAQTMYDLYAVVCHSGTLFFGHYTAYARLANLENSTETDIEWRHFNDTCVTRVQNENQVVDGEAYFLFYKRRDPCMLTILDKYKLLDTEDIENNKGTECL